MIENKLSRNELSQFLRPFLHLEARATVLMSLQDVLGYPIATLEELLKKSRFKITFEHYEVSIEELKFYESGKLWWVGINFRCKQKWWNAVLGRNQSSDVVRTLQEICRAEMPGLVFSSHHKTYRLPGPDWKFYKVDVSYLYDSRSSDFRDGLCQISPLEISWGVERDMSFVNFEFNATGYERSGGSTLLKDSARTTKDSK